ncbi:MAG: MATE family efflux transporter [Lachnospiraceae bacterium]|nr:MATE family efflux transporter [Lachnospiraceae bacterium]
MNMTDGPLLKPILLFAVPLALSNVLQLLFNAADMVVVGRFSGNTALAAVGSTTSLIHLFTNLFLGFAVGVNVLYAHYIGADDKKNKKETMDTAVVMSLVCGLALTVLAVLTSGLMLVKMGTPEEVLAPSTLYLRIYFLGMPAMLFYNFGSSILRAAGDTKHPLAFLTIAGVINVVLNLIFVVGFKLSVAGVALATVISQTISALLMLKCLITFEDDVKLDLKDMKPTADKVMRILRIGVPAGIQGMLFSFSNVLIQSSINSLGSMIMAGNAAAANIENFVYISMNAVSQTCISFVSQNHGARKPDRVLRTIKTSLILVTITGLCLGIFVNVFRTPLLSLYTGDAAVVACGKPRLLYLCLPDFLCGVMEVLGQSVRGLGYSTAPMAVTLTGACLLRILWVFTVFATLGTIESLYLSYPISWAATAIAHLICLKILFKKAFSF